MIRTVLLATMALSILPILGWLYPSPHDLQIGMKDKGRPRLEAPAKGTNLYDKEAAPDPKVCPDCYSMWLAQQLKEGKISGKEYAKLRESLRNVTTVLALRSQAAVKWTPYSKETEKKLLADHKPYFLFITGDFCITCKLQENSWDTGKVGTFMANNNITALKANLSDKEHRKDIQEAQSKYALPYTPAYVFVDKNGSVAKMDGLDSGVWSEKGMLDILEAVK